ncbi:MAG TPA: bacteriohemerythrin [Euryarchaeota archaeon]|nr:bacteriohemerythrin [bacterium BMS3Bbin04]HDH27511.1 bacteriohemerythrin [Euryarchaeota archaeon]
MKNPVFIVWNDKYSVGNDDLDGHHKAIISIINDLYSAIQQQSADSNLKVLLDRLIKYTIYHFKYEEALMEKHSYPGLADHKIVHAQMVKKTTELVNQANNATMYHKDDVASSSMTFLKKWWLDHICVIDVKYKPFLGV